MRCKLFIFGENHTWQNNGVGEAEVKKIDEKFYTVFQREDGLEQSWIVSQQSEYKKDEPSVISFVCPITNCEFAMSFKHEGSAFTFWNKI